MPISIIIAHRLYLALDDHEHDMNTRVTLRRLRECAIRNIKAYANGLALLHASVATWHDSWLDQAWCWLLVQLGTNQAITWLEWDELNQSLLFKLLATGEGKTKKRR